jgi:hypothetical protein
VATDSVVNATRALTERHLTDGGRRYAARFRA